MKETIMKKYRLLNRIMNRISENHTGAYAAQSAFFIVLSMIPFIMLLLALVQYTPVTKADVIRAVTHVLPKTIYPMIVSIVNQVYNQSQAMISLTGLVAIWSAGRGVLAMSAGLNSVYGSKETRNYIYLRLRANNLVDEQVWYSIGGGFVRQGNAEDLMIGIHERPPGRNVFRRSAE